MRLCSAKCLGVCDAVFLSCAFIFLVWICLSQSDSNKTQNTNKIKELSVIKFGKRFTYCHIMLLINEWNLASSPLAGAPNWNKLMFSEQKVVKLFSFMYNSQTTKLPYNHISATVTVEHDWAVLDWAADKLRVHTLLGWDAQKAWLDSDCWNATEETPANLEEDGCVSMCLCKAFQHRKWFGAVLLTRPLFLIKLQYISKSN